MAPAISMTRAMYMASACSTIAIAKSFDDAAIAEYKC